MGTDTVQKNNDRISSKDNFNYLFSMCPSLRKTQDSCQQVSPSRHLVMVHTIHQTLNLLCEPWTSDYYRLHFQSLQNYSSVSLSSAVVSFYPSSTFWKRSVSYHFTTSILWVDLCKSRHCQKLWKLILWIVTCCHHIIRFAHLCSLNWFINIDIHFFYRVYF